MALIRFRLLPSIWLRMALLLLPLGSVAQLTCRVDCWLPGVPDSTECKLIIQRLDQPPLVIATLVLDQQAVLVAELVEPSPAYIWIENRKQDVPLFLDAANIRLTFESTLTAPPQIVGSLATPLWQHQDSLLSHRGETQVDVRDDPFAKMGPGDSRLDNLEAYEQRADSLYAVYIGTIVQLIQAHPQAGSSWYLFAAHYSAFPHSTTMALWPRLGLFSSNPSYQSIQKRLARFKLGQPVPDFELPSLSQDQFRLSSLKSRFILLDFSGSYLAASQGRHRWLKKLYAFYHAQGFDIITISQEFESQPTALMAEQLPWPVVIDTQGLASSRYHMERIPNSLLVDRHRRLVLRDGTRQELETKLAELFRR